MLTLLTQSKTTLVPTSLPTATVTGLYVHIPFCFHKCHYCDFYSITRQTPQRMETFVDLMLREADQWTQSSGPQLVPRTVFFGGGTPTLLPLPQMQRLLDGLKQRFDFSQVQEWTLEANPATLTPEYAPMLRAAGVDRLSFGAQSFNLTELKLLERHHDPDDVPRSLDIARAAGFHRLNLDLIYAIPGQDLNSWSKSLEAALALDVPHLSCYGLTYESNTPIAVRKRLGQFHPAEESLELQMMHYTRHRLRAAARPPYEISNYAIPSEECQHNLLYWTGGDYIGLGPSAASHVQGHRWKNRPHLGEWETAIESGALPAADYELLSPRQRAGELAMLLLRLTRGLNYADFTSRTTFDPRTLFAEEIRRLCALGLIEATDESIHLTENGLNVADAVAGEFVEA